MSDAPVPSNPKLWPGPLPEYTAEKLAENWPNRRDPLLLSGPYTPVYSARAEIQCREDEIERLRAENADNSLCANAVVEIRKACKEIMGGNCSFVDDDFARCLYTLKEERDRALALLKQYLAEFPAFRSKPVGAPHSKERSKQDSHIALENLARRAFDRPADETKAATGEDHG